ncbi:MAG: glycosyltransferase family 9 protein [Bdellovibrionota bacterium]
MKEDPSVDCIIWIQTAFLGDIILSTAAFDLVKQLKPNCRQYLITTPIGHKALHDHRALDGVVSLDKRQGRFIHDARIIKTKISQQISNPKTTYILQPHTSFRSSLLAKYLNFKTITYKETSLSFLAKTTIDRVAVLHETERIALLSTPLGVKRRMIFGIKPSLSPLPLNSSVDWQMRLKESRSRHSAQKIEITRPKTRQQTPNINWIAIAPGSVWGTKRWPKERYIELIKELHSKEDNSFLLLGSASEREICLQIENEVNSDKLINLAGQTSLDDLRRIYPHLSLLISNDSSALHFASAFDTPTLAIFGATTPQMGFAPLSTKHDIAEIKTLTCRPCSDHGPMVCPLGHFHCMNHISAIDVAQKAYKLLSH